MWHTFVTVTPFPWPTEGARWVGGCGGWWEVERRRGGATEVRGRAGAQRPPTLGVDAGLGGGHRGWARRVRLFTFPLPF